MSSKYLLSCLYEFFFSLILCVPLGITLVRIFMIQAEYPFASPHLNSASVLWCLAYGGTIFHLIRYWREKNRKRFYGVLLYGFLVSVNYIWLDYFL